MSTEENMGILQGLLVGALAATTVVGAVFIDRNLSGRTEACQGKLVESARRANFNLAAGGEIDSGEVGNTCTYTLPNGARLKYPRTGPESVPLSDAKTAYPYLANPPAP